MIKTKIRTQINFPKIDLSRELDHVAKKIVIPLLKDSIDAGVNVEGKSHPELDIRTIRRKGHSKPLLETGDLRKSFKAFRKAKDHVIVRIKAGRRKIAEYLQVDGIGKARKRFLFMGVTDGMERDAMKYIKSRIAKLLRNARK